MSILDAFRTGPARFPLPVHSSFPAQRAHSDYIVQLSIEFRVSVLRYSLSLTH